MRTPPHSLTETIPHPVSPWWTNNDSMNARTANYSGEQRTRVERDPDLGDTAVLDVAPVDDGEGSRRPPRHHPRPASVWSMP